MEKKQNLLNINNDQIKFVLLALIVLLGVYKAVVLKILLHLLLPGSLLFIVFKEYEKEKNIDKKIKRNCIIIVYILSIYTFFFQLNLAVMLTYLLEIVILAYLQKIEKISKEIFFKCLLYFGVALLIANIVLLKVVK